jgi:predicted O-methyltransferase YrrM
MVDEAWIAVDRFFTDLLVGRDEVLDATLAAATAAGLPPHDVAPNQGKLLYLLARIAGTRRVLELGTLAGYSTIWLARALAPGGRVVTLEVDARYAAVARANLERAGVAGVVDVRVGPALETLPLLASEREEPFDFVFIDADKEQNAEYLGWALRLTRSGGLVVADNVVRGGAVADPAATDARATGVRRFAELLAAEPRVSATAIQTVGAKGWDGFVIALLD